MILPGSEAQQLATYIGWLMHGAIGGIVAGSLFVLPSFFILCALTYLYLAYGHFDLIQGILYGIKPAVTAIVLFAAYRIGSRALKNYTLQIIALAAFLSLIIGNAPFPLVVLGAGLIGFFGAMISPNTFAIGGGHKKSEKENNAFHEPAIIDDLTPIPEHAKFKKKKFLSFLAIALLGWALVYAGLVSIYGWGGVLPQMAIFFSKAALLTFGGAYAVLPYITQGGVETYQWLNPQQMIDGLALGETTPGPLIMIVSYVGFVGGWTKEIFANQLILSGFVAASVVTFFTFLPSFLFILLGAPIVEATRHEIKFTAPLTAITAAVVGVILNLACFFAYHVFFPNGFSGTVQWPSIIICTFAIIALIRFKTNIMLVIGLAALIGVALKYLQVIP
jgi:chromate transporter